MNIKNSTQLLRIFFMLIGYMAISSNIQAKLRTDKNYLSTSCLEKLTEMTGDYVVNIAEDLKLTYRESSSGKLYILFDSTDENSTCINKILATIKLPPILKDEWTAINSKCSDPLGIVAPDQFIVGIFQAEGLSPARMAWVIDAKSRTFKKIRNLQCKTFN